MALRKINKFRDAKSIGPKKGELKEVKGFLIGAVYKVGATKKKKGNTKWTFQDTKGEHLDVWGNASVNSALSGEDGKMDSSLVGKWVEITFVRMGTAKKGQNAQKICDVGVDDSRTLRVDKPGKIYNLKK